jgi:hypothetical protein
MAVSAVALLIPGEPAGLELVMLMLPNTEVFNAEVL